MDKNLYNRSKSKWCCIYILLVFILIFNKVSGQEDASEVNILFTGDILLSRNVRVEYNSRKTNPWDSLKRLFHSADLVIGNLEGAVGHLQNEYPSSILSPVFDIDSNDLSLLNEAGFKVLSVENNHSLDLGTEGKNNTIKTLVIHNLNPVYFDNSPQFKTIKNVVISFIALNDIICKDSTKNIIPSISVEQKLRLARSLSNLVIVTIHWGSELLDWPNKRQRELANWLIDKGADIIIGSHPHVIQKPEIIKGKPVFFSLGNHLFDQKYSSTKEGLVVEIKIRNNTFTCNGYKTHTREHSFYPKITDTIDFKFGYIEYNKKLLQVNGYILKPISLSENGKNEIVLKAYLGNKLEWSSFPLTLLSINSCNFNGKNEYLFALQKYYSTIDKEVSLRPYVYELGNRGLIARWRGSALAWPLLDAQISPYNNKIHFALHRGDSFINLNKDDKNYRKAVYEWNGFGFKGVSDTININLCKRVYKEYY